MIGLLEQNSIKKDSTNSAKKSSEKYMNALDSYNSKRDGYQKGVGNPVFNIIEQQKNEKVDKDRQNKYERAVAFTGLNKVFHGISSIVSSANGIKPQKATGSRFDHYLGELKSVHSDAEKSYKDIYQDKLDAAITQQKRIDIMDDNYLDGLNNAMKTDQESELANLKLLDKREERVSKQLSDMSKNKKTSKGGASGSKSVKISERKPEMYVYNAKGKRVPLHGEDMTKLHQIGKLNNIDLEYRNAKSNQERLNEYNIMMQRSYLIYERNKENQIKKK